MKNRCPVGFAVLYQWQIKPGKVRQFAAAWADMTDALREQRGALGSRLHRSEQGTWMAYAQWPTRALYERSGDLGPVNPEALERLQDAVEDTWPPVFLTPHDDQLDPIE
ncbi:MAG: hypothetical protein NVS9B10_12500 [Nevskia sp.]